MSVVEVADPTTEAGSTRRVPLGHRVVSTLESARSILNTDHIADDDLRRIRGGDRHAALRHVERTTAAAVTSLASGPSRRVRVLSVQQLMAELNSEWHEIQQDLLAEQVRIVGEQVIPELGLLEGGQAVPATARGRESAAQTRPNPA